jgi:hypothetical protein
MKDGRLNRRGSCAAMWVSPHHPPSEKMTLVMKRAGKRTVRQECVVFGGSLFFIRLCWSAAGLARQAAWQGWRTALLGWRAAGLVLSLDSISCYIDLTAPHENFKCFVSAGY